MITKEQAEQAIKNLREQPANHAVFVLQEVISADFQLSAQDEAQFRAKTLGPMYVVAKSPDFELDLELLDMVRPSRFTSVMGEKIVCGVPGVEVQVVREFDILTYIKS